MTIAMMGITLIELNSITYNAKRSNFGVTLVKVTLKTTTIVMDNVQSKIFKDGLEHVN